MSRLDLLEQLHCSGTPGELPLEFGDDHLQDLVTDLPWLQIFDPHVLLGIGSRVEKIKTVGDAYMCASGLPSLNYTHAKDMVVAALEMCAFMLARKSEKEARGEVAFELRIGVHTGPVVAGIVGSKKFAYDIWGDTVNIASRMESSGEAGQVNISEATYALIREEPGLRFVPRGKVLAKGKGELEMYFVEPA